MEITIHLITSNPSDRLALAALVASLEGPKVSLGPKPAYEPALPRTSEIPLASSPDSQPAASSPAPVETSTNAAPATSDTPATFDAAGLPWDERIHSSSRAINADGTWRAKRGVSEILVNKVTAELRDAISVPAPQDTLDLQELDDLPPPPVEQAPIVDAQAFPHLIRDITAKYSANLPAVLVKLKELGVEGGLPGLANYPHLFDVVRLQLSL